MRPVTEVENSYTQFKRSYAGPIDLDSVFETTALRLAYLNDYRRYAGQIVADLETENIYVLNAAGTAWRGPFTPGSGGGSNISSSIQSADGLTTSFNIAHGLDSAPKAIVMAGSADASGFSYITPGATNIVVVYDIAPPAGVNNLTFYWMANI